MYLTQQQSPAAIFFQRKEGNTLQRRQPIPNIETYENAIDNHTLDATVICGNHIMQNHLIPEDEQAKLLNRMLMENKNVNGSFYNAKLMNDAVTRTLHTNIQNIYHWLKNDPNRSTFRINAVPNLTDNQDERGEQKPIGYGFKIENNTVHKYETNSVSLFLKRSNQNIFGFVVASAYPDVYTQTCIQEQYCNSRDLIRQTTIYQQCNTEEKRELLNHLTVPECLTNIPAYKQRQANHTSRRTVSIPIENSNSETDFDAPDY